MENGNVYDGNESKSPNIIEMRNNSVEVWPGKRKDKNIEGRLAGSTFSLAQGRPQNFSWNISIRPTTKN